MLFRSSAFENVRLAVQEKSFVLVERERADAKLGFFLVNNFAVHFNCRDELVEFWIFG